MKEIALSQPGNSVVTTVLDQTRKAFPCLYIGLPKTATTMLQAQVFSQHDQVDFLGVFAVSSLFPKQRSTGKCRDQQVYDLMQRLIWNKRPPVDIQDCQQSFEQLTEHATMRVPVWCWESLALDSASRRRERAETLRAVFGPSKVIMTIRQPLSLVESVYFQVLKRDNTCAKYLQANGICLRTIDDWLEQGFPKKVPFSHLDYAETARIYADVFGKESVKICLFEQLVENQANFVAEVCDFYGIDSTQGVQLASERHENVRWTTTQMKRLEKIKRSRFRTLAYLSTTRCRRKKMLGWSRNQATSNSQGQKLRAEISASWQDKILDLTRAGNRYLVDNWQLPLEKYGYPL